MAAPAPPSYAILSHDDLLAAFERDDYGTLIRYFKQNPKPDAAATGLLTDWLQGKQRGRGRPSADDVRQDVESAFIELSVAGARSRKEGHYQTARRLGVSTSKITHALPRRRRGK